MPSATMCLTIPGRGPAASVSFIVPVYNVAHYLDDCLHSILLAHRAGDQLILVDDGSTDDSGAICDVWRTRHPDLVTVIHQHNAGLSVARNRGLQEARNPYVYFLDSDDLLCSPEFDAIRTCLTALEPDVLTCDALSWVDGAAPERTTRIRHSLAEGVYQRPDDALLAAFSDDFLATASRIYRRALLQCLAPNVFPPGRCYEDNATIPRLLALSTKAVYLAQPIYRYRQRAGSITQSHTLERCMDQASSFHQVLSELKEMNVDKAVMRAANVTAFKHIVMAVRNASRVLPLNRRNVEGVIEHGLSGLTIQGDELIVVLGTDPAKRKLLAHAKGMLHHRRRYIKGRLLASQWHWWRKGLFSSR